MSLAKCASRTPLEALENFEKAVRAVEMRGSQDPEDRPRIEEEYLKSKKELKIWMSYIP